MHPPTPSVNRLPKVDEHYLNPLNVYDPEMQLGVVIEGHDCPFDGCDAKNSVAFKEFALPRQIELLECTGYHVSARHRCKVCSRLFKATDEHVVVPNKMTPAAMFQKCPVQLLRQVGLVHQLV